MTNYVFIDVFVIQLYSTAIAIFDFQLAALAIWEINWRFDYDLCNEVVICLRSEQIAMDLCARESTDGNLDDHGDQLETNQ